MHVEAGKWGAGGALSNVYMAISVCVRSRTLVCSPACNRGNEWCWQGEERRMLFYLFASLFFTGSSSGVCEGSLIDVQVKEGRSKYVLMKICGLSECD